MAASLVAGDGRGYGWAPAGRGLDQKDRGAFVVGAQHRNVGRRDDGGEICPIAGEGDRVRDAQALGLPRQPMTTRSIADQDEAHGDTSVPGDGDGLDCHV